ncbi:MAG: hypothetical protein KDE28_14280, partial [Anaerolineales bacterium]|nr:hypothetical protein [Anaerolineales bacterium]
GNYDVTLVNSAGLPEQTVDVAADGTFSFDGLVPGVQYAVTIDLGNQTTTAPGIAITENPGWFVAGSSGANLAIGIYPYPWVGGEGQFNTVFGRVF